MGDTLEAPIAISSPCGQGALRGRALLWVLHRGQGRTFASDVYIVVEKKDK
jgi:hypothetical protein